MWARKYSKCVNCGTTKKRHLARGLCARCYQKDIESKHKQHLRGSGIAAKIITKKYLIQEYLNNQKSPIEIAKACGCSRQYIYKKMKEYSIPLRSKHSARKIALLKGKIIIKRTHSDGSSHLVTYQKIFYNKKFFSTWSKQMAYVLGILYTDGCLSIHTYRSKTITRRMPVISLAQKERELIDKVLHLMNCNAKVHYRERTPYWNTVAGELYHFSFACTAIYPDLIRLGMKTTKSLDIKFPSIPQKYVRHFIRGCWDGDGTVYSEKRNPTNIKASFVSGSRFFIDSILTELEKAGLPKRTVYIKNGKKPSYYFRYSGGQCIKLYHYLYDDVPPTQYLRRKHDIFQKYVKHYDYERSCIELSAKRNY